MSHVYVLVDHTCACLFVYSPFGEEGNIQSNLVNLKSSGLEVLFRVISSSNYREVDIKYILRRKSLVSTDTVCTNFVRQY